MDRTPPPDLDALDCEARLDLVRAHEQQQPSLVAAHDEESRRLEAEFDALRQTLTKQAEEVDSRSARIHKPDTDCCPECGSGLRRVGEDFSEQLEYIPESFKVMRHVRPKFTCTVCDRLVDYRFLLYAAAAFSLRLCRCDLESGGLPTSN